MIALAKVMEKRGHSIRVLVARSIDANERYLVDDLTDYGIQVDSLQWDGKAFGIRSFAAAVWRGRRAIKAINPEILHLHCYMIEQVVNLGFPLGHLALVTLRTSRPQFGSNRIQHRVRDGLQRMFYKRKRLWLAALSGALANETVKGLRLGNKYPVVIPLGLPEFWFSPVLKMAERSLDLVHIGRADANKNHILTINALGILARRGLKLDAVLGGKGSELNRMRKAVSDLNIDSHVHCVGNVEDPESLFRQARIAVMPSRYEGLGRSCIEALASGCAFIGSDIPAFREVLGAGWPGPLLSPEIPKLWADALEHLFMAPDRIENLGVVGRARVSGTFTLEREVDDYISLYRRMLESSPISQAPLAVGV